jgi:tetratricopeptide (TPR) repeat protein
MRFRVLWVGCLVGFCWLGLGAGAALADDAKDARELFRKGQAHYAVGEYEAAADAYMNAYKLKPDPALLFNAAQACRLGGKLERALTLYRNYLRFYPDASNVEAVRSQIGKLEKQIETERATATPPPAATAPPPMAPPLATPPPVEASALSATAPPPEPVERPLYKKVWFWGAVGGAVVAAVVIVAVVAAGSGDGGTWNNLPEVRELRGAPMVRW